jgi:hypothetical protein
LAEEQTWINLIDPARLDCEISTEMKPQILRLRYAPLRMTDFEDAMVSGGSVIVNREWIG